MLGGVWEEEEGREERGFIGGGEAGGDVYGISNYERSFFVG